MAHALCLLLDEELVALNRAVGELRRRNLPITSIAVGPGDAPGQARLTVIVDTDEVTAEMTMRKLHKLSGVRSATRFAVDDGVTRELALVKVRVTHERYAELLDVCDRFKATVVDESADQATVQLAGTGSFVLASVRALEGFGILEMVRSGAVALPPLASAQ
ncbi:MAG TPA: acetolactate synthase small subunit [Gemmatimonadales bacterium]